MWPLLLDMTKDESIQSLRNLELEAYSHLVSALRAQGPLNSDKRKLLKETSNVLNISQDRHKAEIRRALSDEKLSTIAYHISGQNEYTDDWAQEGRRVIPLMPRMTPQTAYSAIADEVAENADQNNKQLPLPANTERKRPTIVQTNQIIAGESNKPNSFRVPDMPKHEDSKKRKFSESSSLAQHLLGPSKMSKIQQIYRQKTKSKTKEQFTKVKVEPELQEMIQNKIQHPVVIQKPTPTAKIPISTPVNTIPSNGPKSNVLQNINIQQVLPTPSEDHSEQVQDINNFVVHKFNEQNHITSQSTNLNENLTNRLKLLTKSNNNIMFKSLAAPSGSSLNVELQKTLKMCPLRKAITKTVPTTGQKLIVVSNAQTIPSSSILQRTLTIPFVKNIAVKNFDKFKIVTTTATPITLATSIVSSNSFNSVKHKVVTVRTSNPAGTCKKVFPLTQLQMLNKGSIKVLPLGGKIVGKTSTSTTPSMYFMNTVGNMQTLTKGISSLPIIAATKVSDNTQVMSVAPPTDLTDSNCTKNNENVSKHPVVVFNKSNVIPVVEDYDAKIDEFHIQTVPMTSQESVVEVQCENDVKANDATRNVKIEKSGVVTLPEVDCLMSETVIVDTPGKILSLDSISQNTPEAMEVEIEECTNENNELSVFTDDHLNPTDFKQEMTDVGYIEN